MADEEHPPEERQSPPPTKQSDADEAALPTLTPEELEEGARLRTSASAAKAYPMADEEEIERSREQGGPHSDVPPTDVSPPTD